MRKITTLLFALCVAVSMAQAKSQASAPANKPNIQPDAQRPIATYRQLTENEKDLFKAIEKKDFKNAKKLIKKDVDVNSRLDGQTPLMTTLGAYPDGKEKDLQSLAQTLVKNGADILAEDNNGHDALAYAISNSYLDDKVVDDLFKKAGVSREDSKYQTLFLLEKIKNEDKDRTVPVKEFLSKGFDVNATDVANKTALIMTAQYSSSSTERQHDVEAAQLLLNAGANINAQDELGHTALWYAAHNYNPQSFAFFLKNNADTKIKTNLGGTILMEAAYGIPNKDLLEYLLLKGTDINAQDKSGETALMEAVLGNQIDNIRFLLAKGADISLRDSLGENAYLKAYKLYREEIAQLLKEAGADTSLSSLSAEQVAEIKNRREKYEKRIQQELQKEEEKAVKEKTIWGEDSVFGVFMKGLLNVALGMTGAIIDQRTGTNIGSTISSSVTNATATTSGKGGCKYGKWELPSNACGKCVNNKPLNQSACTACCNSIGKVGLYSSKYYATDPAAGTKSAGYFKPGCYCHYSDGTDLVF